MTNTSIKSDILSRADIDLLVRSFYEKVKADDTIGIIFNEIVPINWEHHIPVITDFWESIILDNPVYKQNAMEVHYKLHRIFPLQKIHFERWLQLFYTTLDELFTGKNVVLAKKRAQSIAALMEFKMKI